MPTIPLADMMKDSTTGKVTHTKLYWKFWKKFKKNIKSHLMMACWLQAETIPIWRNRGCHGKPYKKKKEGCLS